MKRGPYYMLVNKRGNPVIINAQLPIFWNKKVGMQEAMKVKCFLSRVEVKHIDAQ